MGRGKKRIPIARIGDLQKRRVCFAKRRKGFFRKCSQLCELFPGYEVAAVAFSPDVGNPFAFPSPSSPSASPAHLIRRFLSGFGPLGRPQAASTDVGELRVGGDPAVETSGGEHQHSVSDLSSASFVSVQTLMSEGEKAAALQWADGALAVFSDCPTGGGGHCGGVPSLLSEETTGVGGDPAAETICAEHHHSASILSSPSIPLQTLLSEEEESAALQWADGVLALFSDGLRGGGLSHGGVPPLLSSSEEDVVVGCYGATGSVLMPTMPLP